MSIHLSRPQLSRLSRRRFLSTAAAAGVTTLSMPYLSRAADRPQ
ncbi:twin-arginine translocation signal domain-containing protein, partial [Bradyrhizobium sp.]